MPEKQLIEDVEALLLYAAENDLLTGETAEASEALRRDLAEPLAVALAAYKNAPDDQSDGPRAALLYYYSALNKLTGGVSGRSYRDSVAVGCSLGGLLFLSGLIALAILLYELAILSGEYHAITGAKDYVRPLLWGGLGSAIYLLKFLTDKVTSFEFDRRLLQGIGPRIALGAILGLVVVQIFGASAGVSTAAAAFLAGLGVKPIYRALESIVEVLAEKLDFQALKLHGGSPAIQGPPLPAAQGGVAGAAGAPTPTPQAPTSPAGDPAPPQQSDRLTLVKFIQTRLASMGINPGPIDGQLGSRTIGAITFYLKGATADYVQQVNLAALAGMLQNGPAPADWRSILASNVQAPLAALNSEMEADERKIFEDLLAKLIMKNGRSTQGGKLSDPDLRQRVSEELEVLVKNDKKFENMGAEDILAALP